MTVTLITTTDAAPGLPTVHDTPADRNPARVYLASLGSPAAKRTMRQALAVSAGILTNGALNAEELPWGALRFQHTAALRSALSQRYAAAGANKILSAVRGVLRVAWQLEYMTAEDFHAAAAVKSIKGSQEEPAGRALAAGEILALLYACLADPTPAGYRDAAVIALLYACGPRRAELVGLDLADMSITEENGEQWGKLTVRHGKGNKERNLTLGDLALGERSGWITVRLGKGRRRRRVPIHLRARKVLGAYLEQEQLGEPATRVAHAAEPLFRSRAGEPLTPYALWYTVRKYARLVEVAEVTPHTFRHSVATRLVRDPQVDMVAAATFLGHSRLDTTARYSRPSEDDLARAAERVQGT